MDRLNELRGGAGGSGDSTLDTTSPPSEAFMTANESSSKFFSFSEVDSSFDISPIKDVSLASAATDSERSVTDPDELISNLSPINKGNMLDNYKIGKQIEAANILSGGVDIFEDNDNSCDELVIDDTVEMDEKSNQELKIPESTLVESDEIASQDTEVVLQIDGKNVDAIDIGNGIYLYRKEGQEELAAVQIIDDDHQQQSFKFLKVRENTEGNLEVYEEIEIEVPKEVPTKEESSVVNNTSQVPVKDINKVISDATSNKVTGKISKTPQKETLASTCEIETDVNKDVPSECKPELNLNGKTMKFSESRKSPVVGSFTPITYHSTPNKEGVPLTKTMVNQQLHPSRHSDNKKTIELHTDSSKKLVEPNKKETLDKEVSENIDKEVKEKLINVCTELKKEIQNTDTDSESKVNKQNDTKEVIKINNLSQNINEKNKELDVQANLSVPVIDKSTKVDSSVKTSDETKCSKIEVESKILLTESLKSSIAVEKSSEVNFTEKVTSKSLDNSVKTTESNKMGSSTPEKGNIDKKEEVKNDNNEKVITGNLHSGGKDIVNLSTENSKELDNIHKIDNKMAHSTMDTTKNKTVAAKQDLHTIEASSKNLIVEKTELKLNKLNPIEQKSLVVVNEPAKEILMNNEKDKALRPLTEIEKTTEKMQNDVEVSDNSVKDSVITSEDKDKLQINNSATFPDIKKCIDLGDVKESEIDKTIFKQNEACECDDIKVTNAKGELYGDIKSVTEKDAIHENKEIIQQVKLNAQNLNQVEKIMTGSIAESAPLTITKEPIDIRETLVVDSVKNLVANKSETTTTIPLTFQLPSKIQENHGEKESYDVSSNEKSNNVEENIHVDGINEKTKMEIPKNVETAKFNMVTVNKVEPIVEKKGDSIDKKEVAAEGKMEQKPLNNNNAAVPFGQWTEANRQEFLNKIKETKAPVNSSNGKQIKNSNDLNRRDVLKKIDSQRQSNSAVLKAQETVKANLKNETVFTNKTGTFTQEPKVLPKTETLELKPKPIVSKKVSKQEIPTKHQVEVKDSSKHTAPKIEKSVVSVEVPQKKDFFNAQDLINITVDMIHRSVPFKYSEETKGNINKKNNLKESQKVFNSSVSKPTNKEINYDDIEMKMNELHGIPFVERPPHELPQIVSDTKNANVSEKEKSNKTIKIPNLLPFANINPKKPIKESLIDVDSEEEIIKHVPITGDIDIVKDVPEMRTPINLEAPKKETIITENEFDKFARRNSVTYENCLTMNIDGKESHNVIQTVIEKDIPKKYTKSEIVRFDVKSKLPHRISSTKHNIQSSKINVVTDDPSNKQYQSKLQIAYQSALTAKRQLESPITIIEDKPVKVVFINTNTEYIPSQLNVQGQELSPAKNNVEVDTLTTNTCDSLDTELFYSTDEGKLSDETKTKVKHQRKQVLTPVEEPELELIQPGDLGIEVSPKKKRKTEDNKHDKHSKNLIHKKSYLLGRTVDDKNLSVQIATKVLLDAPNKSEIFHDEPVSAIDSLVKAAELLENQSENAHNTSDHTNSDSQPTTPVKRGRGRPRKYPLPESADKNKVPSPQKKPRLIDAKPPKRDTTTEEESSDDEIVKENWTMGKINENIVCPICNKLFRSENVVFKHVKHCTGVSPSRSDSEKRSPRRFRQSKESESKSDDMDIDDDKPISSLSKTNNPKKRKSKDSITKSDLDKNDIGIIEDISIKQLESKLEKRDETKQELKKFKSKIPKTNNLVCEFCGKTFRQHSYLVNHKLQHKKEEKEKQIGTESDSSQSIFTCEICKKAFRKLHHLVQHRIIHNAPPSRVLRKSSSEQHEGKIKDRRISKHSDDPSAGFRCEPCDKSFRKLHHLVEHRETHDGINRQKTTTVPQINPDKSTPAPECDICKKTFRKLHHLIEHKEQHNEDGSDKSDDKSVKSTLSTKDIIHECSLCYMVFPNEHSLNKHTVICQRKKRQSKQVKSTEESENSNGAIDKKTEELTEVNGVFEILEAKSVEETDATDIVEEDTFDNVKKSVIPGYVVDDEIVIIEDSPIKITEVKSDETEKKPSKLEVAEVKNTVALKIENGPDKPKDEIVETVKKIEVKEVKTRDTPKKKTPLKEKIPSTITKRKKTADAPLQASPVKKKSVESSDDDEIRYMLNPDFKYDTIEGKFMKVRAKKRNSLQIERPNSKDLVKRRTSLQHSPKVSRLKSKQIEVKVISTSKPDKASKLETPLVLSTDSDDSDVKYSLPEPVEVKTKPAQTRTPKAEIKTQRKVAEKRKSLTAIAKRKSVGMADAGRQKLKASPGKSVRRRTREVEHRCDCGQLFSSAALLSRHTTLAHTPPRIRKRRSPPPEPATKHTHKPIDKTKPSNNRKSSTRSDTVSANKSKVLPSVTSANKSKVLLSVAGEGKVPKSGRTNEAAATRSIAKPKRTPAHRGVPMPDRMKKLAQKNKK